MEELDPVYNNASVMGTIDKGSMLLGNNRQSLYNRSTMPI
jgi:hypothetical protein